MKETIPHKKISLHSFFGLFLFISFFLTWVKWENTAISGYDFPQGRFFSVSATQFNLANPFPEFDFTLLIFWGIPLLIIVALFFSYTNKKSALLSFIAGALSLSLVTVFILFSKSLLSLGVGESLTGMMKPGLFLHLVAAIGFILTTKASSPIVKKMAWLAVGPVFAFVTYLFVENYIENEKHAATENVKADYTVSSSQLISEFLSNDTASNKKYVEKVLVVSGPVTKVEVKPDSTSTLSFEDSTGSYAIFSLEKSEFEKVSKIKAGNPVSVKGVCSGSIFSEILGTTSINFKRSILDKN